jgi:hypothetical protein
LELTRFGADGSESHSANLFGPRSCTHATHSLLAAPKIKLPFLTDIDSRAEIKGSRDPLGFVPVWSRFGRKVVGNLSTVSNSVRGFTTLLLGYYFAEQLRGSSGIDQKSTLEAFLKFEQMASYARLGVNSDRGFRGVERVAQRLSDSKRISLGVDAGSQILSNQKIYGLWGLFSVPSRECGLLKSGEPTLSEPARTFVEKTYIARLKASGQNSAKRITELLQRDRSDLVVNGRDKAVIGDLAGIHAPTFSASERQFYKHYLVNGGDDDKTNGCQRLLATLLADIPPDSYFGLTELQAVTKTARNNPAGDQLAEHLESIQHVESILVPMANAFAFLLTRDRQPLQSVASDIASAWGKRLTGC